MVYYRYFPAKNPALRFWRVLHWLMPVCFMAIWFIFRPFGILQGTLVYFVAIWLYFVVIWYIFHVLVNCTTKNLATLTALRAPPSKHVIFTHMFHDISIVNRTYQQMKSHLGCLRFAFSSSLFTLLSQFQEPILRSRVTSPAL
jgi:hypothetical protein